MKRFISLLLITAIASHTHAAEPAKKAKKAKPPKPPDAPTTVPPHGEIDKDLLDQATRASLLSAIEYFRKVSAEDDEGWIVPPKRNRQVVGSKTVTLRYRQVEKEVPVYEYEREKYEVVAKKKTGQSVDAVVTFGKQTRTRIVSRKQVGTRKVTTRVRDDDGPIKVEHKRPVYGPGGPDTWYMNGLGNNALALFALRKAGLPEDDELVRRLSENLATFMWTYGLPDATWDVAWCAAAFSTFSQDNRKALAGKLTSKLLDGQIREGEARGLWGPVCINVQLMAEFMPQIQKRGAALVAAKKAAKSGLDGDLDREHRADLAYREVKETMDRVAMSAMAGPQVETRVTVDTGDGSAIHMAGLAHYIYNQTSADLGSTALVLYVLREVAGRGLLPEVVWRPKVTQYPDEKPSAILARTAYALANAQRPEGWDEMNKHQPFKGFQAGFMFPGVPPKAATYPKLDSPRTLLTQAQGFQALANTGNIVGFDKLMGRYGKHVSSGLETYRKAAETFARDFTKPEVVGGHLSPYECAFFLQDVAKTFAGVGEDRPDLKDQIAYALLTRRQADGSWNVPLRSPQHLPLPTSLRARMRALAPKAAAKQPLDYAAPHVSKQYENLERLRLANKRTQAVNESTVPTALSMICLADGLRPPVVGQCLWTASTEPSQMVPLIVQVMQKRHGPAFQHAKVQRPITSDAIAELPGIFVRGAGTFNPSTDEKTALGDYLKKGGFVVVEMAADAQGLPFFKSAQSVLKELLPGSTVSNIGADKNLLGEMAGKGTVMALKGPKGSLAAVFLPIATRGGRGGLAGPLAAQVAYNTLLQKIDPAVLEDNYAIASAEGQDADALLQVLFFGEPAPAAPPPAPAEPGVTPLEPGGDKSPPAKDPKKPAADEVW